MSADGPVKILFLGSGEPSLRCLGHLLNHVGDSEVVGIIPNVRRVSSEPDRKVRVLAREHEIELRQFQEVVDLSASIDLGCSVLFDTILPPAALGTPRRGWVNAHLGPLPRLRGVASVYHALRLAREEDDWTFGVTLHYMDAGVDTGPIIDHETFPILEDDTAGTLHARACDRLVELFARNIGHLLDAHGRVEATPQEGGSRTFRYADINHEIDLAWAPEKIYDMVRALTFPGKGKPFIRIGNQAYSLSLDEDEE